MATYKVKKGDNLTKIARSHGVSMADLIKLNNIKDPNKIYIDQELKLPDYYEGDKKPSKSEPKKLLVKKGNTEVITSPSVGPNFMREGKSRSQFIKWAFHNTGDLMLAPFIGSIIDADNNVHVGKRRISDFTDEQLKALFDRRGKDIAFNYNGEVVDNYQGALNVKYSSPNTVLDIFPGTDLIMGESDKKNLQQVAREYNTNPQPYNQHVQNLMKLYAEENTHRRVGADAATWIDVASGGILSKILSPTLTIGVVRNLIEGDDIFGPGGAWWGNSGLVSEEWAAENPGWSTAINIGGDLGITGAVNGVLSGGTRVKFNPTQFRQNAADFMSWQTDPYAVRIPTNKGVSTPVVYSKGVQKAGSRWKGQRTTKSKGSTTQGRTSRVLQGHSTQGGRVVPHAELQVVVFDGRGPVAVTALPKPYTPAVTGQFGWGPSITYRTNYEFESNPLYYHTPINYEVVGDGTRMQRVDYVQDPWEIWYSEQPDGARVYWKGHPNSTVDPDWFIINRGGNGVIDFSTYRVGTPEGAVARDSTLFSTGNPFGFTGLREVPGAIPQEAVLDESQSIYIPYLKSGGVFRKKLLKRK